MKTMKENDTCENKSGTLKKRIKERFIKEKCLSEFFIIPFTVIVMVIVFIGIRYFEIQTSFKNENSLMLESRVSASIHLSKLQHVMDLQEINAFDIFLYYDKQVIGKCNLSDEYLNFDVKVPTNFDESRLKILFKKNNKDAVSIPYVEIVRL